ncbi:MAG TPA: ATP synthase F1 subunit epsilon [Acidimicrobiales bacterium]|nr:ATP synthase F1 subunit epsilon [Acidimicrobiales bacterium]
MATFPATIVTPERQVASEDVTAVIVRTVEGDATFLPGHTRLIGALVPYQVRFQHDDGTELHIAVHGGFVQVDPEHVTVLAPIAELAGEIDRERAELALGAAEARLAELGAAGGAGRSGSGEEDAAVSLEVTDATEAAERARLRLEVAGAA